METSHSPKEALPPIPAKRYFTIGEVSELCGVKPHVLRYWEQEFTQLMLVITAVAAPLDRLQLGEFLLPIAQDVRLDSA